MANYNAGNAITEYVLPGMLVTVVCISGFLALGGHFNGSMLAMKKHMTSASQTAHQQIKFHQQQAEILHSMLVPITPLPASVHVPPLSVQAFSGDPKQTSQIISTLGANGATELLANKIGTLCDQWAAEGKITEAQANILRKLSAQGHELAQYEKMLSDALLQGKTSMVVDGKTYSLTEGLGFFTTSASDVWNLNPEAANPLNRPFAQTYQEFLQIKSSFDPAISQEVSALVIQISAIDDALKWSAEDFLEGDHSRPALTDTSLWEMAGNHFEDNISGAPISRESTSEYKKMTSDNSTMICQQDSINSTSSDCNP